MVTFVKKDIVQESMKYQKGLASKPEPFKCIEASTEVYVVPILSISLFVLHISCLIQSGVKCFVNLLRWEAVASPDYNSAAPSLPLSGGLQSLTIGHSVFR